jgi:hypothetical protein
MTMQQPQQGQVQAELSSALNLGWLWSEMSEKDRKSTLKELQDWAVEVFDTMLEEGIRALGLERREPDERLGFYYAKTIQEWEEQRAKYPLFFDRDQTDFGKLREREAAGDLVAKPFERPQPELRA